MQFSVTAADVMYYLSDPDLDSRAIDGAIEAEAAAQKHVCRYAATEPGYPEDLREALLRRIARNFAMRNLPLGMTAAVADAGIASTRIGSDPEIRRLEAPYRKLVLG